MGAGRMVGPMANLAFPGRPARSNGGLAVEVSLAFYDAAMKLAEAVQELRSAEMGGERVAGVKPSSATEMRNRWRRLFEERGLKVDAALSAFRAASASDR